MEYYRKAIAVFIVIITLITPLFLEDETEVAVVEINTLIENSSYFQKIIKEKNGDKPNLKSEIMALIKSSAAEYAAENNYSSVITKDSLYKGGKNITDDLIQKIDQQN